MHKTVLDTMEETIWLAKWPDQTFVYISPSIVEFLGYTPDDFYKNSSVFHEIIDPRDLDFVVSALRNLPELKKTVLEFRITHKNGTRKWVGARLKLVEIDGESYINGIAYDIQNRKITEIESNKHSAFLQKVIDTVPDLLFVRDAGGRFVIANKAVAKWYNTSLDNLIGKTDYDFNPNKKEVNHFLAGDRRVLETGKEYIINEEKITHPDGSAYWTKTRKRPICNDHGLRLVLGLATNVTETKNIQLKLERQNQLKELLLHLATRFINAQPDQIPDRINEALAKIGTYIQADRVYILEYLYDEEITKNTYEWCNENISPQIHLLQAFPLKDMQEWVDIHWQNQEVHYPNVAELPDGPIKAILQKQGIQSLITIPIIPNQYCYGSIGFDFVRHIHDSSNEELEILRLFASMLAKVYDSENVQKEMSGYRERIDAILNEMPGSIWSVNWPEKDTLYFSPSAEKLYGRPMSEIAGNSDVSFEFTHPEDKEKMEYAMQEVLEKGFSQAEYRMLKGDGSYIWINTKMQAVKENGKIVRVHGTDVDITQQKEAEALLQQAKSSAEFASRAKSQFLANMSHELRTPLTSILGFSETLESTTLDKDQTKMLDYIIVSANALKEIVGNILDIAKIEAGKFDLYPKSFNVHKLIKQTASMIQYQVDKKRINLVLKIEKNIPNLFLDPIRLQQVLLNLLSNAVKFTDKGSITVTAKTTCRDPLCVYFEVADTGIGISEDYQELIFQQFQQVDGSSTRKYGGVGLGLTICSEILNMMDSKIFLQSKENAGSTFYFTVCSPESNTKEEGATKINIPVSENVYNILFAEDDMTNIFVLNHFLKKILPNSRIIETNNGRQALNNLSDDIDLVIMDLNMPVMDGWTAAAIMRVSRPDLPIIAVTAAADDESVQKAYDAGCFDCLTKPYSLVSLATVIKKWLVL